jgi:acyl carrier protein
MIREEIQSKLTEVFREIFADDIVIVDEMTADDVDEWDSLSHVDMICMVEEKFNIKLVTKEIARLKNVGELISLIETRLA